MGDAGAVKRWASKDGGRHGFHRANVWYIARWRRRLNGDDDYHGVRFDCRYCHVAVAVQKITERRLVYIAAKLRRRLRRAWVRFFLLEPLEKPFVVDRLHDARIHH